MSLNNLSSIYAAGFAAWSAYKLLTAENPEVTADNAGWRPEQWDGLNENTVSIYPYVAETNTLGTVTQRYFFDAIIRTEHTLTNRITEHPIQTGANFSDHFFSLPDRITMEIGMSDSMDSLISGQWSIKNKSISAYGKLKSLKESGARLVVNTRLNRYQNMIIESLNVTDTFKTRYGLRATVSFRQIFTAKVSTITVKSTTNLKQVIDSSSMGTVQPQAFDETLFSKYNYAG